MVYWAVRERFVPGQGALRRRAASRIRNRLKDLPGALGSHSRASPAQCGGELRDVWDKAKNFLFPTRVDDQGSISEQQAKWGCRFPNILDRAQRNGVLEK
jgi:hypothetical protein